MLHMILLNVNAESLVIEEVEWQKVIETARACTWTPRGTLAPPIDMEQPAATGWDGRYYPPVGQEVTRADAAALGQALAGAPTQGPRAVMLQAYCRKGGFVITKPAAPGELQIDSLLALAAHMEPSQAPEFAEATEAEKVRVLTRS